MPTRAPHTPRLAATRRGALCLLALITLGANPVDDTVVDQNRARIERMTAAERSRLEYLFGKYQDLSETERRRLRTLHAAIAEDARRGGVLRDTMEQYRAWLKTLPPWQRDELRNAPSSDARLQLVRKLKDEQEQRQLARSVISPEPRAGGEGSRRFFGRLEPDEREAMMAVLEQLPAISSELSDEMQNLPAPHRHIRILTALFRAAARPGESSRWLDEATVDELAALVTTPRLREPLDKFDESERRRFIGALLVHSVTREAEAELDRRRPRDDQLEALFLELDPEQQIEISKLPREAGKRRLTYLYFQNTRDPFARDMGEYRQAFGQLFRRDGRRSRDRHEPREN